MTNVIRIQMSSYQVWTIDESVPEFSNQYQYQYQYWKKYSVQYKISTSTAQILTVPVLSTSTTNIDKNPEIVFHPLNSSLEEQLRLFVLGIKISKKKLTHSEKLHGRQFFLSYFLLFLSCWYWYWLTQYLRDQYQYRVSTWKFDQYQYQYQYISTKNDQWTEKNQYQYQWTDSSIPKTYRLHCTCCNA